MYEIGFWLVKIVPKLRHRPCVWDKKMVVNGDEEAKEVWI